MSDTKISEIGICASKVNANITLIPSGIIPVAKNQQYCFQVVKFDRNKTNVCDFMIKYHILNISFQNPYQQNDLNFSSLTAGTDNLIKKTGPKSYFHSY